MVAGTPYLLGQRNLWSSYPNECLGLQEQETYLWVVEGGKGAEFFAFWQRIETGRQRPQLLQFTNTFSFGVLSAWLDLGVSTESMLVQFPHLLNEIFHTHECTCCLDFPNLFSGHTTHLICSFEKRFVICRFREQEEKQRLWIQSLDKHHTFLLSKWLWQVDLTFVSFSFHFCKRVKIEQPQRVLRRITWDEHT